MSKFHKILGFMILGSKNPKYLFGLMLLFKNYNLGTKFLVKNELIFVDVIIITLKRQNYHLT
jgi:hypothetical protein